MREGMTIRPQLAPPLLPNISIFHQHPTGHPRTASYCGVPLHLQGILANGRAGASVRVLEFHQRRSHAVCLGQDAQDLTGLLLAFGMTARRVGLAAKILKILRILSKKKRL